MVKSCKMERIINLINYHHPLMPSLATAKTDSGLDIDDIHLPGYEVPVAVKQPLSLQPIRSGISITQSMHGSLSARYALSSPGAVHFDIFDMSGRAIWRLSTGMRSAGRYCETIRLPAEGMGKEAYLICLQTNENSYCDKFVWTR
jgi:hypothetical protein